MRKLTRIFVMIFIYLLQVLPGSSQTLEIEIYPVKTSEGEINLTVYRNKETFAAETPFRTYIFEKTGLENNKISITITDLEKGKYGISIFDDVNRNGKLDYHLFVPCEGFGFSNYHFKKHCKPEFEWFSFELGDSTQTISIPVYYF